MAGITTRQHKISSVDYAWVCRLTDVRCLDLYKPRVLSLPSNDNLKSLLTSLSTRLANRYLVTRVIQYSDYPYPSAMRYSCDIAKPFVWYRNESAGSLSEERFGNEFSCRAETEGDQTKFKVMRVNDVDEMEL